MGWGEMVEFLVVDFKTLRHRGKARAKLTYLICE